MSKRRHKHKYTQTLWVSLWSVDTPLKAPQSCSRVIYHLKLFQLSFSRVLRLFSCPLSNVVVMTKWWVPSIVASDRAAAAGLSAHFHMWFYDLRRAIQRHDSASLCLVNSFFSAALWSPTARRCCSQGTQKMHITLPEKNLQEGVVWIHQLMKSAGSQ